MSDLSLNHHSARVFALFCRVWCFCVPLLLVPRGIGKKKEEGRKKGGGRKRKVVEVEKKNEKNEKIFCSLSRIGEATGFGPPLIRQHANDSMKYKTRTIGF